MLVLGQLGLRAGSGLAVRKWVRNVAFATHAILGGARRQKMGRAVKKPQHQQKACRELRQQQQGHT
jgi:hypothetical protein